MTLSVRRDASRATTRSQCQREHFVEASDEALGPRSKSGIAPVSMSMPGAGYDVGQQGDQFEAAPIVGPNACWARTAAPPVHRHPHARHITGHEIDVAQDRSDVPARRQVGPAAISCV